MMPYARFSIALTIASLSCLALVTSTQEFLSGTKTGGYGIQQSVSGISDENAKRVAIVGKLGWFC